jgi:hypothetical protein
MCGCASGRPEPVEIEGDAATPSIDAPTSTPMPDSSGQPATCTQPFSGTLASWTFTTEAGSQTMTPVYTKAAGITAGAVMRSAGLTAVSGTGSINSSNWPTSAQRDVTKYYTLNIAPPAGCTMTITAANVDALASGTGPVMAVVSTSADSYAQTAAASTTTASVVPVTGVANQSGMIELRVYGYAAGATGGTLRLKTTLSLTGSLQ